ncbi:MAG: TrbC/VirB2 family protein [Muribaculaceae bacterium]|nr:TrbC/VirB2 family protein [Muribaculaceae bacterium]
MKKLISILLLFLLLLACSCKTQRQVQYVPVESSHTAFELDSLNRLIRSLWEHSIQTKESEKVSVKETNTYTLNEQGDTIKIIIEKEKDSSKEIQRLEQYYLSVIDSISKTKVRVDSIDRPVPYPVTEYVEVNRLYWWQKGLMWIGGIGILFAGFNIVSMIRRK